MWLVLPAVSNPTVLSTRSVSAVVMHAEVVPSQKENEREPDPRRVQELAAVAGLRTMGHTHHNLEAVEAVRKMIF